MSTSQIVFVPCSIGELIDKITILEIKTERINDAGKRANVIFELQLLRAREAEYIVATTEYNLLADDLRAVNAALWDIEDAIRDKEKQLDFGPEFVSLARGVYKMNDRRSVLKRQINELHGSRIVEEKSYSGG